MNCKPLRNMLLALALLPAGIRGQAFVAPEPEDLIIYQIFLDRFDNGDPSNDDGNPRTGFNPSGPTSFQGGDIEGIRRRLPYIRNLGANAIWMTPFVENVNNYHGYAAYDWYNVDPNFGTIEELRDMITEANDLGIAVYFDMVAGHMGDLIRSNSPGYAAYLPPPGEYTLRWRNSTRYPAPFNDLTLFHAHGQIENYFGQEQEIGTLAELDDLKTETPFVREQMLAIWTFWMEQTPVSGFRIDTVKHVEVGMWEYLLPGLRSVAESLDRENFYTFGEIYGADDGYMRDYIGDFNGGPYKMDSAVDFQFYYTSNGVFARADRPPSDMVNRLASRASQLGTHHLMMPNFIDNHDVPRFLDAARGNPGTGTSEQQRRLELALTFMLTAPGPPIIYYGTEQGFDGGSDPYNRENMWDGEFEFGPSLGDNFDQLEPLYRLTKRLTGLRAQLAPLRRGGFQALDYATSGPGEFVFLREHQGEGVLVVLNTSTSARATDPVSVPAFASNTVVNALDPTSTIDIDGGGVFPARTLPPQSAEIWIRAEDLPPQVPEVTALLPSDGSTNISTNTPGIAVRFLLPMNPISTRAALSLSPDFVYTVEWNEAGTEVLIVPSTPLEPQTDYTVTVASTALSLEGTSLAFPSSATWRTGRAPLALPPAPAILGVMEPLVSLITVDGSLDDWPPMGAPARNSAAFPSSGGFVWLDALNDADGPGTYTHPTDVAFTGSDADIDTFRVAHDDGSLYIAFRSAAINPGASFFTPYLGIGLDTGPGGRTLPLGIVLGSGIRGISELSVREDFAPEFEIIYTGPIGGRLIDQDGTIQVIEAAHDQSTGIVEMRLPRDLVSLAEPLLDRNFSLVVYTGLETFGGMREVTPSQGQWDPGGGITETTDPDAFDLIGATPAQQHEELSTYDQQEGALVLYSVVRLTLASVGDPGSAWSIY